MNNRQTVKDLLNAKIGNKKSAKVIEKLSHAYKKGIRAGNLDGYLNDVLVEEGAARDDEQTPPWIYIVRPEQ